MEQLWERFLYPLLLVVAVVVMLYSLFGIATLLGYLPLSPGANRGAQVERAAPVAAPARAPSGDAQMTMAASDSPCAR